MNNDKITKLENNIKLKKEVFSKNIWKNYAIVPPAIVIFAGILGVVYLLNIDKLLTLYAIPFILIFVLGTIWLKSTRRYLINNKIKNIEKLLICPTIPLIQDNKKTIILFSTGNNRHNKYYLEKQKKDILNDSLSEEYLSNINNNPTQIEDTDLYLIRLPLSKKYSGKAHNELYVVFTGKNPLTFMTSSELNKYK